MKEFILKGGQVSDINTKRKPKTSTIVMDYFSGTDDECCRTSRISKTTDYKNNSLKRVDEMWII